ncbi:MAG TPA: hypothetical protein VJV79_22975 [Polyangiaceae bacterium]|nr:hypothetical protein [Polyangiaceae bacterium]
MKLGVGALGTMGLLVLSSVAFAQTPPARKGFQMDIRTGWSMPMGTAFGGGQGLTPSDTRLWEITSGHVPFIVDIGAKVMPELFVGGYFGLGFGGAGGKTLDACEASHSDCSTVDLHFGVEAQYHILPAGLANPWIGYGLGFESFGLRQSANGISRTTTLTGFEFARFMGGVDFRITRVFGVGPFIDLSMASFSRISDGDNSQSIDQTRTHTWLTFGARFVLFP